MADFTDKEYEEISGEVKSSLPEDVTGQYPDPGFFFKENTNKEALGEQRNNLVFAGTAEKVKYTSDKPPVASIPGLNQVSESLTGHVYEVDDTPGNERILIKHKDGAGIELKPDGSICISALNNRVEVTGGNQSITIVGDAQLTYQGNLDMKVNGEFNIECNEFNVDVKNNKKETIGGAERKEVYKGSTNITVGDVNNFITNKETNTILGGQANNVKGNMDYNIHGNAAFYSSGEVNVTSEDFINIASDNVTASANNMTVQGGTGVIGGTGVDVVGNGAIFNQGVKAPTFHGDLNGLAAETRSQSYGEADTSGGAAITNTITPANLVDSDEENYNVPDASVVSAYTSSASGGVKKVLVDETSKLKNYLDRTEQYGGVTNKAVTTPEARSILRDPGNRDNSKLVETLLENDVISENYNDPIPPGIGRIVDVESSAITSDKPANAVNKKTNVIFIPRNEIKQFLPDPNFNPLNTGHRGIEENFDITAKTLLAPNISLSKFLGTDHPVNLKYIRNENKKRQIAKHLYLQTFIIKMIQENKKKFDGITLKVSEGLYRPGPTEKITPGSINDLKSKGRAVAYKAVNSIGEIEVSRMFDIASYLIDKAYYDIMILSYDTYIKKNGEPVLDVSLIITMPELDDNYTGTFTRDIFTEFNSNKLTQAELVEVLPTPLEENIEPNLTPNPTNDKHDLDPRTRPELRSLLISAANEMGLTILSGYKDGIQCRGLRPVGSGCDRSSGRHNDGYAHDISLSTDGTSILKPFKKRDHLVLVEKYSRLFYNKAKQAGFKPSIGWGSRYMEGVRGHFDIAADIAKKPSGDIVVQSHWGNSAVRRNAPRFLREIFNSPPVG